MKVTPIREHPLPYNDAPEAPKTFADELAIAANTAAMQSDLGAPIELTGNEEDRLKRLLTTRDTSLLKSQGVAYGVHVFLESYAKTLAFDAARARVAVTNKLMDLADCGDPRIELQALTLLGKHSDIGLFTERSEVTVRHTSAESLENTIKEKIGRLLHGQVINQPTLTELMASELATPVYDSDDSDEDD